MKESLICVLALIALTSCKKTSAETTPPAAGPRNAAETPVVSRSAETPPPAIDRKHPQPRTKTQKKPEYPVAKLVAGKPGFVFSPYSPNMMVDVRGINPGTLVQDPTAPSGQKNYFRVPE